MTETEVNAYSHRWFKFFHIGITETRTAQELDLSTLARLCLASAKLSMCAAEWDGMHEPFPVAVTQLRVLNVTPLPLRRRADWAVARSTFRRMFATIGLMLALTIS
jgi:hypothetical protein